MYKSRDHVFRAFQVPDMWSNVIDFNSVFLFYNIFCYLTIATPNLDLQQNHTVLAHWLIPHYRLCVCVSGCPAFPRRTINSPEPSWCRPRSIPGLEQHPPSARQCLRHGLPFSLCTSSFLPLLVLQVGFIKETERHTKLYYPKELLESLSLCSDLSILSFIFLTLLVFLHIILLPLFNAFILPGSFSVPTYYWWVDFTSRWCREGTVQYAVCEGE